ncbi:hypothetical protein [Fimbriiglobus ruber]|uniref:hypothetical protein n=1 Tax=Fimbriiglobus ruber TaxID=1908690 RepID=UPI00117A03FC|nr:hypothetical protein [Fimbriiglobus ruber]
MEAKWISPSGYDNAGIAYTATASAGSAYTVNYLQNIANIENGANGTGAGAVAPTFDMNLLPINGMTMPCLDTDIGSPGPAYGANFKSVATGGNVTISSTDSPSTGSPLSIRFSKLTSIDVQLFLRMYVVATYEGGWIYPLAHIDWQVLFYATGNAPGAGVQNIMGGVTADSSVATNDNPFVDSGKIYNGNMGWQFL